MRLRAEDDEKGPESAPGAEPDGKCRSCGMQNEEDAKFCDQCGESMEARALEDEEPPESSPPSSKSPESQKERAGAAPPTPERAQAPAKMRADASIAAILGATSESPLAIKTAAIRLRQVLDTAAGITGKTDPSEIVGALLAVPHKLARGKDATARLTKLRAQSELRERGVRIVDGAHLLSGDDTALLPRLLKTGTVLRSKIVEDLQTASGDRRLDAHGRPMVRVRSKYVAMDLGILRGMVTDLEGDAPRKRRDPFEPDAKRAKNAAPRALPGAPPRSFNDDEKVRLREHPMVKQARARSSALSDAELVAGLVNAYPQQAEAFLAGQNGVAL